jgi:hypothetical protein
MAESVARHDRDGLAFYVGVPREDVALFRDKLGALATIIERDEVVTAHPRMDKASLYALPGIKHQQVIKSDFWRLGLARITLVSIPTASSSGTSPRGFLADASVPFTVMHDGHDVLDFTARHGPARAARIPRGREPIMREMGREGVVHDYGYAPYVRSRHVARPRRKASRAARGDARRCHRPRPSEFVVRRSAAALRSIPVHCPRGEYFRFYHYEHQYWHDRRAESPRKRSRRTGWASCTSRTGNGHGARPAHEIAALARARS